MKIIAALLCLCALAGCATTEFRTFESAQNYFEGTGATKVVVDGMEIWDDKPPRKFTVLGVLFDKRRQGPLLSMLDGDMVKEARKHGGDALVRTAESTTYLGSAGNSFSSGYAYRGTARATGFGTAMAINQNETQYAVIRYLDRAQPQTASPPSAAAGSAANTTPQQPQAPQSGAPTAPACFLNSMGKCMK
ncbi:MAG: hypothetical protein WA159_16055 [Variovorax sp.]